MKKALLISALALTFAFAGCGGKEPPEPSSPVMTNASVKAHVTDDKERFVSAISHKLEVSDQKMAMLVLKFKTLGSNAKTEGSKALEAWHGQRARLGQKLDHLKASGQEIGADVKAGFAVATTELEEAIENIKARFNG